MAVAGVQTTLDIILVYREGGKIKSVIFIFDTLPLIVVNNMLFVFFINLLYCSLSKYQASDSSLAS